MSEDIKKIRKKIDSLDEEIISLLNQRAQEAVNISKEKEKNEPIDNFYNPEREAKVLRRIKELNKGPLSNENIVKLYREIMSSCLSLEAPLKVSYLGPKGTYTQQATQNHFGKSVLSIPHVSVDEVFSSVEKRDSHYGVVPVENSTQGIVSSTLDMFMKSSLKISGEIEISIHHNILSSSEKLNNIKKLYAHPQSFSQCKEWIEKNMPECEKINSSSNAEAALIASKEEKTAAIASEAASEIYKLNIISKNIEDNLNNSTRFLVIGDRDTEPSGNDKTSIIVSTKNNSGALYGLLEPLSKHNVSMTRIESRPSKHNNWEYIFYLDLDGHIKDKSLQKANDAIKEEASLYRFLGSYPAAHRK
jgi:chorismate mutase/prephenate dehydratase|tara:strand:- start:4920 stop:6002 length:1083 start_codon:yes stop_codon:yes gene_type:complete